MSILSCTSFAPDLETQSGFIDFLQAMQQSAPF